MNYSKKSFQEDNKTIIFANGVNSILDEAAIIGKLYYETVKYNNTHIVSILVYTSENGNIYAINIEDNNIRDNYKHSYNYNILSSTGIYTNATSMELIKHSGTHQPREWIIT